MPDSDVTRLCETYRAHAALGNEMIYGPGCVALRNDAAPQVYDANFVWMGADAEIDSAFRFLEQELGHRPYRNIQVDPATPPSIVAELALRDFVPDPTLQLLLHGELEGPPPEAFDIRRVESDAEWQTLEGLFRADHIETDQRQGTEIFSEALTREIVAVHRLASDAAHFFQAWVDDQAVAFFSSWPGDNGVGMVEDLFTLPTHRNRGIARALIHHCVSDARARGADKVLIGAEPDDTPKNLYAAMGFRPTCITTRWLEKMGASS